MRTYEMFQNSRKLQTKTERRNPKNNAGARPNQEKHQGCKISDKPGLQAKYINLRNRAVFQMRADTLKRNADRISEAKNEGETWKFINDIIKPRSPVTITITTPEGELTDELEIATAFNE